MLQRRKSKVTPPPVECPLIDCMSILGGAWTPNVIWFLSQGPRRFSELKEDVTGISAKVLTTRLKKLEADGVVHREVVPSSPPTVEYSLTELGHEFTPVLKAIVKVGQRVRTRKSHQP